MGTFFSLARRGADKFYRTEITRAISRREEAEGEEEPSRRITPRSLISYSHRAAPRRAGNLYV